MVIQKLIKIYIKLEFVFTKMIICNIIITKYRLGVGVMVKGAERKESAKIIQFRAPSEYFNIINIITYAINKKIKEVGSTDFYNVTDVMKLSIESLLTGKNSINILNREFVVNELIDEELARFYSENYKEDIYSHILLAIKKELLKLLIEIEDSEHQTIIDTKDYQLGDDLIELKGLIEIWRDDVNSIDIEEGIRVINSIIQEKNFNSYDPGNLANEIENILMSSEYFEMFQGLKLKNNYRYSLILTYIRDEIRKFTTRFNKVG